MDLPGLRECCWTACAPETAYPTLRSSSASDVVVVGAGIVGLTTAYVLATAGVAVTVVEARKIGRQVTGRSTAKITSQHALIYRYLIRRSGIETARLYADANATAARNICEWARIESIACDLEKKDAYAYTSRPARRGAIDSEAEAARSLGLEAESLDSAPLPFTTVGALRFPDQAQFNPARYLIGLAAAVKAHGGRIYENTRVTGVNPGKRWHVAAGRHHLAADQVVLATNLPVAGPVHFDEMTQPRSHVVMAFRASAEGTLDGMFIDIDRPTHSLRMGRDADGPLLIVLGAKFRTGQEGDVARRFRQLESWVRGNVPAGAVAWRWVNEDYDTSDRIPYAGAIGRKAPGLYVATGFNAWGISNGTAAGMTISDQIRGQANPWTQLYDPARKAPKHFNRGGDTESLVRRIEQIPPGAGGVVKRGKEKIAVWRSPGGKLQALSASCTHMGCTVTWNNADLTWDCPCHGSIFSHDGAVIHGPATKALPRKKLPPQ